MPLSKARDRKRKRLARLENKNVQPVPLYNPLNHKIGDRVLIQRGKRMVETVIPELDADGNPIPDYEN